MKNFIEKIKIHEFFSNFFSELFLKFWKLNVTLQIFDAFLTSFSFQKRKKNLDYLIHHAKIIFTNFSITFQHDYYAK